MVLILCGRVGLFLFLKLVVGFVLYMCWIWRLRRRGFGYVMIVWGLLVVSCCCRIVKIV